MDYYIKKYTDSMCVWKYLLTAFASIVLSVITVLGRHFIYSDDIFATYKFNYVEAFEIKDIALCLIFAVLFFVMFSVLTVAFSSIENVLICKRNDFGFKKQFIMFFYTGVIICVLWLPYILSSFPSAIFSDGFSSIYQSLNNEYNNLHPIMYSMFVGEMIKIGMRIGGNLNYGLSVYMAVQSFIMAAVLSYFVVWLRKKNVSKIYCWVVTAFFGLFPLFPFYAVTLWKDTLFSLSLLLFTLVNIDIVVSNAKFIKKPSGVICYAVTILLVSFLRNNGYYIVLFSFVVLCICFFRHIVKQLKAFLAIILLLIIGIGVIQGPVYKSKDMSTDFVESIGVPMQQVFAVFANDGKYTDEQEEFISKIWSVDEIKEKYTPCLGDTPKWYMDSFNSNFLNTHKRDFVKVWVDLFLQNPKLYVDAWLMETLSFWNPYVSDYEAYVQIGVWDNPYGIVPIDCFQRIFGFSFLNIVEPESYISPAILLWALASTAVITLNRRKFKNIVGYAPAAGAWLTIMIASPLAISFRYMYILILLVPLWLVLPSLKSDDDKWWNNKRKA